MNEPAPSRQTLTPVESAKKSSASLDIAYGCFGWIALTLSFDVILMILPMSPSVRGGYEFLIGMPLVLIALAAGLVGLVLTLVDWREWELWVASGTVLLFLLLLIVQENSTSANEVVIEFIASMGSIILVSLCGRWFFFRRRLFKRCNKDAR